MKEWTSYTSIAGLDGLETLKAVFYKHAYGRHFHEGYALGVILKGSETWQCNKKIHVAPTGHLVAVNPGEIHDGHASNRDQGWGYFMIYPRLGLVQKALAQMGLPPQDLPVFQESVFQDPEIARGMVCLMQAIEAGDSRLALETAFLELMCLLISRCGSLARAPGPLPHSQDPRVGRIMDLIESDFDAPLTLDRLAHEAGLSPWALHRLFKKQTGLSPYLLQTRLRLSRAKQALATGIPPADAAAMCGFADQSHMTKQFRKWMGITPGDIQPDAASR